MASLNMKGPHPLDESSVKKHVDATQIGNYALSRKGKNDKGGWLVHYVGRSDKALQARLLGWVKDGGYKEFKYSYANSATAAFNKECRNYHDFGGSKTLDNNIHPDRPSGTRLTCDHCDELE